VVLEDGRTFQPVVWGNMQVRRLCQQVGEFAHVPPDTVVNLVNPQHVTIGD
jgi:hypothetical protein